MTFKAGRARTKIAVQTRTVNADKYGDHNESWATVHQPYAEITDITYKDKTQNSSEIASAEYLIRFRACSEIGFVNPATYRISVGGFILDIIECHSDTDTYTSWTIRARVSV